MWVSERTCGVPVGEPGAEIGIVTIGGSPAGVNLGGERRWLSLCTPGGYHWRPAPGDRVLVLKAGGEQESPFILGVEQADGRTPGEVGLTGPACALRLDGTGIRLEGQVWIGSLTLEDYIRSVMEKEE